ncbi:unnamed protein product [Laminaria digitata]
MSVEAGGSLLFSLVVWGGFVWLCRRHRTRRRVVPVTRAVHTSRAEPMTVSVHVETAPHGVARRLLMGWASCCRTSVSNPCDNTTFIAVYLIEGPRFTCYS